jgi:hypothetical protein
VTGTSCGASPARTSRAEKAIAIAPANPFLAHRQNAASGSADTENI